MRSYSLIYKIQFFRCINNKSFIFIQGLAYNNDRNDVIFKIDKLRRQTKHEVKLKRVAIEERQIFANLLEKYIHEFSKYTLVDVNPLGLYGDLYLDYYWVEHKRWAYFIYVDAKLAGFVIVNN